jgi:uncharacterized protein (AIM24 family)
MAAMHEIDYKIFGDDMQFVEVELDPHEATVAEAGGMMYMDDGIEMETIFGDGSQQQSGFLGALMGAGKRLLTGESLFMTVFLNRSGQRRKVAFGAPYPGKIVPIHLRDIGGELVTQKDSFLAAAKGVSIGIALRHPVRRQDQVGAVRRGGAVLRDAARARARVAAVASAQPTREPHRGRRPGHRGRRER